MLYQGVMENSLRSGKSQGKVRKNESRKKLPPCSTLKLDHHILGYEPDSLL